MNRMLTLCLGILLAVPLGFLEAEEPRRPIHVPKEALHFNGKWYQIILEKKPWPNAKQWCEKEKGRLACIHDAETQAFLTKLANGLRLYVGATDEKVEGRWIWVDGKPMVFKNWGKGQPDNSGRNEHYLHLRDNGKWNDRAGGHAYTVGFICEWGAKPL